MIKFKNNEWEFLQEGINLFSKYQIRSNFNCNGINYCYLSRNENYGIVLDVKCFSAENVSRNKMFMFEFENDEEKISMYYCSLQSKNYGYAENGQFCNLKFRIKNVERTYKNNQNDVNLIKEFYLNSITDKLTFCRRTKYFDNGKYFKVRDVEKDKLKETKDIIPKEVAGDWLLLELEKFSFILQQVNGMGPEWSNNMYIEYQDELKIPSFETRQKNREILSFLLGKYLIKVGETHFDGEGNIIKEVAMFPQISPEVNLKNICNKREVPAIYCMDIMLLEWFEKDLSILVDAYLSEDELNLSNILEYLMGSTLIPREYEIVGIGGCLDELCENWSKSPNSNYDEFIITKKNFDDVMGDLLPIIEKKFDKHPYVFNKIQYSYNLIGYGKIRLFLDEININQGKAEKEARRYRNIAAHGQKMTVEAKLKMVYYTDVYRTFVNRIILKILGHNQYFDLTSYKNILIDNHLPEKDFKENIDEIKEFYKDYLKQE